MYKYLIVFSLFLSGCYHQKPDFKLKSEDIVCLKDKYYGVKRCVYKTYAEALCFSDAYTGEREIYTGRCLTKLENKINNK